jgi:hypothetical protein
LFNFWFNHSTKVYTKGEHMEANALTKYEPATLADAERLADKLARSGIVPDSVKGKPADLLVIMMCGHELGLQTMQALRGISVVNGKPIIGADLAVALVKRHAACGSFRLIDSTERVATYETERRGEGKTRMSYTIQQAEAAGLTGRGPWKAHPAAMLRARCSLALARAVYPDVLMGVYDPDEALDMQRSGVAPAVVAEINAAPAPVVTVQAAQPEDAELVQPSENSGNSENSSGADPAAVVLEKISAAGTLGELRALGAEIKAAELGGVPAVRDAYASRQAEIRRGGGR